MIRLLYEGLVDPLIKDLFKKLADYLNAQHLLKADFIFKEITFTAARTNMKVPHGLNKVPRDLIQLSVTNGIAVTWNYDLFSNTELDVTVSAAGSVRFFIGTYVGGNNV
jgi:hypothetical protein